MLWNSIQVRFLQVRLLLGNETHLCFIRLHMSTLRKQSLTYLNSLCMGLPQSSICTITNCFSLHSLERFDADVMNVPHIWMPKIYTLTSTGWKASAPVAVAITRDRWISTDVISGGTTETAPWIDIHTVGTTAPSMRGWANRWATNSWLEN